MSYLHPSMAACVAAGDHGVRFDGDDICIACGSVEAPEDAAEVAAGEAVEARPAAPPNAFARILAGVRRRDPHSMMVASDLYGALNTPERLEIDAAFHDELRAGVTPQAAWAHDKERGLLDATGDEYRAATGSSSAEELLRSGALTLRQLRELVGQTQEQLASTLGLTQSEVSRIESRSDHLVSTLRRYVAALGGTLELVVVLDGKHFKLRLGE